MNRSTFLAVDDDPPFCDLLRKFLEREGHRVLVAATTEEAQIAVKQTPVDMVLLDVRIPNTGGLELCRWLRTCSNQPKLPVLMISALNSEADKVTGLDAGADDYLAKPFSQAVLSARIHALMRRSGRMEPVVTTGDLSINYGTYQVMVRGNPVHVTPKEYDIINVFMKNPGKLLTRRALCDMVWGYNSVGNYKKIDKYVLILRSKLGDCGDYIKTAWGLGYRFIPYEPHKTHH